MRILKFGGTSVAGAERIAHIAELITDAAAESAVVVVVSAFRGVTDTLVHMARIAAPAGNWRSYWEHIAALHRRAADELGISPHAELEALLARLERFCTGIELLGECTPRMLDEVAAFGELLSSVLLGGYLARCRDDVAWHDVRNSIITDGAFTAARVEWERSRAAVEQHLQPLIQTHRIVVTQGYIARSQTGATTTLGRGGSDYSAAILGACLGAERIEIWTDVPGIMSADPRRIPDAQCIPEMTLAEVAALSAYGARVLHPQTIEPAVQHNIPVVVRNTFDPSHPGTTIVHELSAPTRGIRAVTSLDAFATTTESTALCQGLLASIDMHGYTVRYCRHADDDVARPVSVLCCVGAQIHHAGAGLEQIARAASAIEAAIEVIASAPCCILLAVDRLYHQRALEALHREIITCLEVSQ